MRAPSCIAARRGPDPAASLASFFSRGYAQYPPVRHMRCNASVSVTHAQPLELAQHSIEILVPGVIVDVRIVAPET